jgi:starch-binding outer membrane protein, SusD/RagB family
MKTKYIKLIVLLIGLGGLSACEDFLNIKPQGQVVLDDFWKNESDVDAVISTCYRELLSSTNVSKFIVWGELRSDNMTGSFNVSEDLLKIINGSILPTNSYTSWASLYSLINYCNSVLYYAPLVIDPNFTTAELNAKQAEALTLRALAYFYLVRIYKEVPLVLTPSLSDQQDYNVAQSSEDVILDQLEADLIKAEGWAMNSYGKKEYNKGRITKAAVRALLADIYLWRNKYQQCATYCDKIISDPLFELIKADDQPYSKIFGIKNSSESIFEIQYTLSSNTYNNAVFQFYGSDNNPRGSFTAPGYIATDNTVFINTPEITDVRRKDYITTKDASGFYRIFKYTGKLRTENSIGNSDYYYRSSQTDSPNWIFYRLTDVMLMKAEALVQQNSNGTKDWKDAIDLVNTVYLRSNPTIIDSLSLTSYPTKKDMEELVLLERQRELMFEGKRWFDLMRLARRDGKTDRLIKLVIRKSEENSSVMGSKLKDMNSLYWPILESELKANPSLKQNPFYENDLY